MGFDLVVRGGTVFTDVGRVAAHVYVADGRIAEISTAMHPAARVVEADGLFVLPGMVDTHVHLMDPGSTEREDFPTGTAAAAARGVTSIIEHTHAHPVVSVEGLDEKVSYLAGRSNVDFGLAAHVWPGRAQDLAGLWRSGVTFFKIFTCTTHGIPGLNEHDLSRAFEAIAGFGGTCLVHCEDQAATEKAKRRLLAQGREDGGTVIEWRSREAERTAVSVVAELAVRTGVRATVAHASSPEVVEIVTQARERGADLVAETCPQYLALREDEVLELGALRKFTPPARARSDEDEEAMWSLVRSGGVHHMASDHAPSTMAQKRAGSIWEAPFGLPGLDTTMPILLDAASEGRLRYEDVVRVYARAPAIRYGLYPRKGVCRPGADADLVLVDPAGTWQLTDRAVISKAGWSPYSPRTFRGTVDRVFLRGEEVAIGGEPLRTAGGRFLPGPPSR